MTGIAATAAARAGRKTALLLGPFIIAGRPFALFPADRVASIHSSG